MFAVEHVEVAVGVEATDVARLHPAVDDALGRRLGVVPEAAHLALALGDDLAHFAGLHGLVVLAPDLQLREGQRRGIAIGSTSVWS